MINRNTWMGWITGNISTWIGVGLIYSGFTDLVSAFVLARIRKVINKRKDEVDMTDVAYAAETAETAGASYSEEADGE